MINQISLNMSPPASNALAWRRIEWLLRFYNPARRLLKALAFILLNMITNS